MKKWIDMILDVLYPPRCLFCYELLGRDEPELCSTCEQNVPFVRGAVCMKCGKELTDTAAEYCPDCRKHPHFYEYGRALLNYTELTRASIVRYKYKNQRGYSDWFGKQIAKRFGAEIRGMQAQALVPVPLYIKKKRVRGFNQAQLVAEVIGREIGLPVRELLERRRSTAAQKELGRAERLANLEESFCAVPGQRMPEAVILVDDIYTTGSTMDACAAVLKRAGVRRVYFLAIAIGRAR